MKEEKLGQEPAFPELITEYDGQGRILLYQENGMSKRFYAACAAMQGMLSNEELRNKIIMDEKNGFTNMYKLSFECADKLLKEENK